MVSLGIGGIEARVNQMLGDQLQGRIAVEQLFDLQLIFLGPDATGAINHKTVGRQPGDGVVEDAPAGVSPGIRGHGHIGPPGGGPGRRCCCMGRRSGFDRMSSGISPATEPVRQPEEFSRWGSGDHPAIAARLGSGMRDGSTARTWPADASPFLNLHRLGAQPGTAVQHALAGRDPHDARPHRRRWRPGPAPTPRSAHRAKTARRATDDEQTRLLMRQDLQRPDSAERGRIGASKHSNDRRRLGVVVAAKCQSAFGSEQRNQPAEKLRRMGKNELGVCLRIA